MQLPELFGLLNVNKPEGVTSRDVVNNVQKLFKKVKVGHAGTLDPLASGVLLIGIGPATRLVSRLQEGMKEYQAQFRFGATSDTDDATGKVQPVADARPVTRAELESRLPEFIGEILQVPPQFSAVHVEGQRAYDLARSGKTMTLTPRTVVVSRIEILSFEYPDVELLIECGSGTYIRSIGRDLGERLGCGAIMTALVRTRSGPFKLEEAVEMSRISATSLVAHLIPPQRALGEMPRYACSLTEAQTLLKGQPIDVDESNLRQTWREYPTATVEVALVSPADELYGIAEFDPTMCRLKPQMMFLKNE
ncbi:MAG: tRNA pseudouridine(55) synthase TruB [Planctomycetaceae bacterium]